MDKDKFKFEDEYKMLPQLPNANPDGELKRPNLGAYGDSDRLPPRPLGEPPLPGMSSGSNNNTPSQQGGMYPMMPGQEPYNKSHIPGMGGVRYDPTGPFDLNPMGQGSPYSNLEGDRQDVFGDDVMRRVQFPPGFSNQPGQFPRGGNRHWNGPDNGMGGFPGGFNGNGGMGF